MAKLLSYFEMIDCERHRFVELEGLGVRSFGHEGQESAQLVSTAGVQKTQTQLRCLESILGSTRV